MPLMPGSAQSMTITSGRSSRCQAHGLFAVAGFADHRNVRLVLEHAAKAAAHQAVIVHQQARKFYRACGSVALHVELSGAPESRLAPAAMNSMLPPSSSARSRMATSPMPDLAQLPLQSLRRDLPLQAPSASAENEGAPRPRGSGMAGDIVQRLLQDAVNMNGRVASTGKGVPDFS